eukprot:2383289-Rhodomonas_salina.1
MMFLGLVGTTLGRLSPDAILMRFGLAHRAAEAYFVAWPGRCVLHVWQAHSCFPSTSIQLRAQ